VQVWVPDTRDGVIHKASSVECAHGDEQAEGWGEARRDLDCARSWRWRSTSFIYRCIYRWLNELLEGAEFHEFVEASIMCGSGAPRCGLGFTFERCWRSISRGSIARWGGGFASTAAVCAFLLIGLDRRTPDHSTIARTRRLIDMDTHS
jgi:hypothetical protein